jgi:hypothetical protein
MSFLKARQVVQTCVLSTRWRHLWRSVPCLDIDQEEFKTAGPNHDTKKEWHDFEDFTDHLLIPNNISIALLDTFRLQLSGTHTYPYYDKKKQAARWIRRGIKYGRQDPGIQHKELNSTPWRLKRLHLSNVYLDDRFMEHINSGCQYLEELELKDCECTFHEITSHTLKKLILKNCRCSGLSAVTSPMLKRLVIDDCQNESNCQLVIMAPAVAYLLLSVGVWTFSGGVLLNGMPSLAKALIYLRDNNEYESKFGDDQFKLLDSVSNVTSLYLSDFKAMVWPSVFTNTSFPLYSCHGTIFVNKLCNTFQVISEEFPEFLNLRTLLLEKCDLSDNFQMLGYFLQHSPNLVNLTLHYCKVYCALALNL